jgi:hypothetical protein
MVSPSCTVPSLTSTPISVVTVVSGVGEETVVLVDVAAGGGGSTVESIFTSVLVGGGFDTSRSSASRKPARPPRVAPKARRSTAPPTRRKNRPRGRPVCFGCSESNGEPANGASLRSCRRERCRVAQGRGMRCPERAIRRVAASTVDGFAYSPNTGDSGYPTLRVHPPYGCGRSSPSPYP